MKIWVDDIRPAPQGYLWAKSVNEAIDYIRKYSDYLDFNMNRVQAVELIDLDHDAGDYACYGGDYINILKWMEKEQKYGNIYMRSIPIHIHSMNPVGVQNMRAIIQRNGWKEI